MPRIAGAHILAAVFAVLYGVFWFWYGGAGKPLTDPEIETYLARFESMGQGGNELFRVGARFEAWMRADDGGEFFMVNLIDDPADAEAAATYDRAILPQLARRASFPVFLARPFATFIEPEGHHTWDTVAIMRYRSLRDLLDVVAGPQAEKLRTLKEASVSNTHVLPTHMMFSFIWVRFIVAVFFVVLGVALHFGLRRFGWYRR